MMMLEQNIYRHLGETKDFIMASLNLPESETSYYRGTLENRLLENLSLMTGKKITRRSASKMLKGLMKVIKDNENEKRPYLMGKDDDLPFLENFQLLEKYRNDFQESRGVLKNLYKDNRMRSLSLVRHSTAFLYYLSFYLPGSNKHGLINPYLFESFFHNKIDSFAGFKQCQVAAWRTEEFSRIINLSEFGETFKYRLSSPHHDPGVLNRGALLDSGSNEDTPEYEKAYLYRSRFTWISFSHFQLQSVKAKFDKSYEACRDEKLSALISVLTNMPTNKDPNKIDESFCIKRRTKELGYSFESSLDLIKERSTNIYPIINAINLGIPIDTLQKMKSISGATLAEFKETVDDSGIDMMNMTNDQLSWITAWMGDEAK